MTPPDPSDPKYRPSPALLAALDAYLDNHPDASVADVLTKVDAARLLVLQAAAWRAMERLTNSPPVSSKLQ
jgi:hypothetical protein